MQINRSNYEIWFIDWFDGNLNDIQTEKLMRFLKENPDLKEEFDETVNIKLNPSEKTFPHKNHLKKSTANVTDSQFEYMCVAYVENDLSAEQCAELKEIVDHDSERRRIFEMFQKAKLTPGPVSFKRKNLLIRRTIGQNVLRYVIIGLSAAAVIIFGIIAFNSKTSIPPDNYQNTAQNSIEANKVNNANSTKKIIAEGSISKPKESKRRFELSKKIDAPAKRNQQMQKDSLPALPLRSSIIIEKVTFASEVILEGSEIPASLIALHSADVIPPDFDDGQSRFSKFIAKAFREKLLREKTPKDSPLKAYEIAEAGITGLNKLLGWEMALDERKDENGKLKSVYFSSKLLKFNAPVNKVEPVK